MGQITLAEWSSLGGHKWGSLGCRRGHQIAADPATLAHQLALAPSQPPSVEDLLRAARHIGLKARLTKSVIVRSRPLLTGEWFKA